MNLIERLQNATEGSRELDGDIFDNHGGSERGSCSFARAWPFAEGSELDGIVPRYSTSIDAALTLVPEGMLWSIGSRVKVGGFVAITENSGVSYNAATPALALCVAALEARKQGYR